MQDLDTSIKFMSQLSTERFLFGWLSSGADFTPMDLESGIVCFTTLGYDDEYQVQLVPTYHSGNT